MRLEVRAGRTAALHYLTILLGGALASTRATPPSCLLQHRQQVSLADGVVEPDDASQGVAYGQRDAETLQTRSDGDLQALRDYTCRGSFELPSRHAADGLHVVVAGHPDCDVAWLGEQPYRARVVSDIGVDGSKRYFGFEAGAYLSFILENYENLPRKMAFMHGHRNAWEVNDEAGILQSLDPGSYDFASLTKKWAVDFPAPELAITRGHLEEMLGPGDPLVQGLPTDPCSFSFAVGAAFLVDRQRVLQRPKQFWQRIYDWLQEDPDYLRSKRRAMSMEFTWHMLMGEAPEMLPPDPRRLCPRRPDACVHEPYTNYTHLDLPAWRFRLAWFAANDNDGRGAPRPSAAP